GDITLVSRLADNRGASAMSPRRVDRVAIAVLRDKIASKRLSASVARRYVCKVTYSEPSNVSWLTESRGVVVLQWPDEANEAQRLEGEGVPHLLLVADGATPPVTGSCFEDWLCLPATDCQIRTRLLGLAKRVAHHSPRPQVDELGQCTHRGRSVFVSQI